MLTSTFSQKFTDTIKHNDIPQLLIIHFKLYIHMHSQLTPTHYTPAVAVSGIS